MQIACEEARQGVLKKHGGPFGACIVLNNKVISRAHNTVLRDKDPTCHAEVNAIRGIKDETVFKSCVLYTTCEPCPMCRGVIDEVGIKRVVIGADKYVAEKFGFDDIQFMVDLNDFYDRKKMTKYYHNFDQKYVLYKYFDVGDKVTVGNPYTSHLIESQNRVCIVYNKSIIASGVDAFIVIRQACKKLNTHILDHCNIYFLFEPNPSDLCASLWARLNVIHYSISNRVKYNITNDKVGMILWDRILKKFHDSYRFRNDSHCTDIFKLWKNNNGQIY